ncbi:MAG: hypothetical protein KGN79_06590 [Acidobacteriota bacterium]|nr:hypothetical protein [Acidobacteriota bacterium]
MSEPKSVARVLFSRTAISVLFLSLPAFTLPLAAQHKVLPLVAQAQEGQNADSPKPETHITPEQAKKLFGMVDELLKFSSDETGYAIKSTVKRKLTTRDAVEAYVRDKFNEDQDAKRMQRSEIVLKKFGMLDRDFDLKPFLLELLKEQIEAYYDPKTKTVNMLDWVSPDEQRPVLAHELTHALQDQHVDLDKWGDQTPEDPSTTASGDIDHLAKDEMDTAREAVLEGQATAVMMDNILKPMGRSLIKDPEVVEYIKQQMTGTANSPVMARAPLLLSESLLFPYREGLSFEQDVWMDKGQTAAFAGALDRPPSSSWEIINPRNYEAGRHAPIPLLPNIHPLVDATYTPYDIGQMGELDVQILTQVFGGEDASRDLAPAWDGGLYWAGQLKSATVAQKATTKSIALLYLSVWKSPASAQAFAKLYASSLGRIFSGLKPADAKSSSSESGSQGDNGASNDEEQIFDTDEGPVVIRTRDRMVFVSESFPLPLAGKLADLIMSAQGTGELQMASLPFGRNLPQNMPQPANLQPLTESLVRFMSNCGVMKAAVDAGMQARKTAGAITAPAN